MKTTLYKVIKKSSLIDSGAYRIPVMQIIPENTDEPDGGELYGEEDPALETGEPADAREDEKAYIAAVREMESEKETIRTKIAGRAKEQAQRTAELIIGHTLENAKDELDRAVTQGYSDGFEKGKTEALGVIAPSLGKIGLLAGAVKQAQDKMLEGFIDEMFEIIAGISQKILHREIDKKDEYLLTLFEDAVKNIKAEKFVRVTVSGAQAEFATRNIDLLRAKVSNIDDFKIISDENAEKWTMVVETEKTVADASFYAQMGEIDAVLEQMKKNLYDQIPEFDQMIEFEFENGDGDGDENEGKIE